MAVSAFSAAAWLVITMRCIRPTARIWPGTLEPERGGVAHTRRRAQAVPGSARTGGVAPPGVQPARHGWVILAGNRQPAAQRRHRKIRSSTARAAVREVPLLTWAIMASSQSLRGPPASRMQTHPRALLSVCGLQLGVGPDRLTAFRWRGRPSPSAGVAMPSRTIKPMALTITKCFCGPGCGQPG
jgi:hypothetical protein